MSRRRRKKKRADENRCGIAGINRHRMGRVVAATIILPAIALCFGFGLFDRFFPVDYPPAAHAAGVNQTPHTIELPGFGEDGVSLPYRAEFVGSQRCAKCHRKHAMLSKTHHMALTGIAVTADDAWFTDERLAAPVKMLNGAAGRFGRYERTTNGVFMTLPRTGSATPERIRVDAVFGSLAHSAEPLAFEADRRVRELPLSFSPVDKSWVITPAQSIPSDIRGMLRDKDGSLACVRCHGSVLAWHEDRLDPKASVFGVSCERCHGPGSAHVALFGGGNVADRAGAADDDKTLEGDEGPRIYNPGNLDKYSQTMFCSQCHRAPADLTTYEILTDNTEVARHAGAAMMLSACFRESPRETTISCLDCHNPHRNIDHSKDNYNASCRRCHSDPASDHVALAAADRSNCVECHMTKVENVIAGVAFTSHWIRNPEPKPLSDDRSRPEFPSYLAFIEGVYRERLNKKRQSDRLRGEVGISLAEALFIGGQRKQALAEYAQALQRFPNNTAAYHSLIRVRRMLDDVAPQAAEIDRLLEKFSPCTGPSPKSQFLSQPEE